MLALQAGIARHLKMLDKATGHLRWWSVVFVHAGKAGQGIAPVRRKALPIASPGCADTLPYTHACQKVRHETEGRGHRHCRNTGDGPALFRAPTCSQAAPIILAGWSHLRLSQKSGIADI